MPELEGCNYILARPRLDGRGFRDALYIGQTKNGDNRLSISRHEKFLPAQRLGATEVHVHLLTTFTQERLDIETDLRHEHPTPLNNQPTPAPATNALGLSGLGSLEAPLFGGGLGMLSGSPPASLGLGMLSWPFDQPTPTHARNALIPKALIFDSGGIPKLEDI